MKKIENRSLIILCLFISLTVYSRENNNALSKTLQRKDTVDASIGGTGLAISTNYSRIITVQSSYFINASIGIGTVPSVGGITLPHQLTFNLGQKNSFLELGLGGSFWSGKSDASGYTETLNSYHISPIVGWKKNFENDLVFRAYANPLFHISGEYFIKNYSVIPYLGLALGYDF